MYNKKIKYIKLSLLEQVKYFLLIILISSLILTPIKKYYNYQNNIMKLKTYKISKFLINNDTLISNETFEYKDHFIISRDSLIILKSNIVWKYLGDVVTEK